MTKAEKAHMDRVAQLGCILCRRNGYHGTPAELHHPRTGTGAGRRAAHTDVIPLCPYHHRSSNEALHAMGRKAWERHHGITELELLDETRKALEAAR
ncbi:MAG: Ref family recombination enhancement nuclease [Zoogloea oleivorans]|jgi:hypothetical protein|uniref:Ref family recombination enhancement nuclease n=1 Tax=Zoogloea oleivorans TaxID=1552750 RepID=UPI002A35957A|nr:Ref family recombination enhancement nuclease [Zoogloea oleivorans]MDY0036706.1 Ref family recombination enhancement nuclease [Zoogloea oleivorans]